MCLPSIDTWKGVLNIWESLAAWIGNEVGSGQLTLVLFWILTLLLITCRAQYIGDGSDRRASLLRIPSHGVIPYPLFSSAWHLSIMSNMIENQSNGPSFLPFVCHHLLFPHPLIPNHSHSTTYAVYSTPFFILLHPFDAIFVIQSSPDFHCTLGWWVVDPCTLYCYALHMCVCDGSGLKTLKPVKL